MRDMTVDHVSATLLLALDEERGFRGLRWKRIDGATYDMWVEENPGLAIVPAMAKTAGRAGRDQAYAKGDTLQAPFADVILLETGRTSAKRVRIVVRDSTLVPLMFDGEGFSLQEEMSR
jgi:hypothetical protein